MWTAALWLALIACSVASPFDHSFLVLSGSNGTSVVELGADDAASLVKRAKTDDLMIVAYRSVHDVPPALGGKSEWASIKENGFIQYTVESGVQLGRGTYFSPTCGAWPTANSDYYCAILADRKTFNAVTKVYVPPVWMSDDTCPRPLFFPEGAENRKDWLHFVGGPLYSISDTILVSLTTESEPKIQFLFPPALLTGSNPLQNIAHCMWAGDPKVDSRQIIGSYGAVDWMNWENLRGQSYYDGSAG